MADISISTGAAVQPVFPDSAEIFPFVPAVAFTQGQAVAFNSSGKGILADSNLTSSSGVAQQFRGLALEKGGTRQGVSLLKRGHVAGFDLSALAYGAKVYLSDTAGAIADTPSATKSVVIGQVVPMSDSDATKILYVDATLGWTTGYGRDAIQSVTISATGGTFTLTYGGQTTSAVAYNATAATLQAALEALSSIGTGNVFVTGAAGGPYLVTFQAALGLQAIAIMTGSGASLTGGSGTVTMAHVISGY
jgi:hypothetical protein